MRRLYNCPAFAARPCVQDPASLVLAVDVVTFDAHRFRTFPPPHDEESTTQMSQFLDGRLGSAIPEKCRVASGTRLSPDHDNSFFLTSRTHVLACERRTCKSIGNRLLWFADWFRVSLNNLDTFSKLKWLCRVFARLAIRTQLSAPLRLIQEGSMANVCLPRYPIGFEELTLHISSVQSRGLNSFVTPCGSACMRVRTYLCPLCNRLEICE